MLQRVRDLLIHHPRATASGKYVTLSAGACALVPPGELTLPAFIAACSTAMQRAKGRGKNTACATEASDFEQPAQQQAASLAAGSRLAQRPARRAPCAGATSAMTPESRRVVVSCARRTSPDGCRSARRWYWAQRPDLSADSRPSDQARARDAGTGRAPTSPCRRAAASPIRVAAGSCFRAIPRGSPSAPSRGAPRGRRRRWP